jgi:chorismate mutase
LWIGARTTVNPFAVQEIADALRGSKVPVMIKNPVNPDLELWLGAFERMEKAGLSDLVAIHRGFSFYNHPIYRNAPHWEIPIALRERLVDLPLICDPSHITGNRTLLEQVSQKAMDLNFDGLMLESHLDPDKAWSDPKQQITPEGLAGTISNLIVRTPEVSSLVEEQLKEMREKIAVLDDRLFDILSARMQISADLGVFKLEHNITILQQEHWARMIGKRLELAEDYELTEQFIRKIMDAIHQESIRQQTKIMHPNWKASDAD